MTTQSDTGVLSDTLSGGPKGLGDPEDRTLRRVETEVLVPKIMREKAKTEKCADLFKEFNECCKKWPFLMFYKCREQNKTLKECQTKWYNDQTFRKECEEIYLKKRSEYRRTGDKEKVKRFS